MRRRAAQATPPADKIPFLEGLRGLAALYVVLGHLCSMADPSRLAAKTSQASPWLQSAMAPFQYGNLAVAAFIVISGFCLQLSLYHNGTGRIPKLGSFFRRRARRILPPYYACLGLSLVVCHFVTSRQQGMPFEMYLPVTRENVLAHLFLVHNLSLDWMYKINGVLWSIALECQLYVLFPLLVLLMARYGRIGLLGACGLVAGAVLFLVPGAMKLYPWYLVLFSLGMISASFSFRPNLRKGTNPWLAVLVAWPALAACGYACTKGASLAECDTLLGIGISCLLYAWTVRPTLWLAKTLSRRKLVILGGFSYSLYLMHHPFEQVVYAIRPWFIQGVGPILTYLAIVGLPIILLFCNAFANLFERPFMSRRKVSRESPTRKPSVPVQLPLRTYATSGKGKVQVRRTRQSR